MHWKFISGLLFKGTHAEPNQMNGWWQALLSCNFFFFFSFIGCDFKGLLDCSLGKDQHS